jgi:anti-sigma regulatory factor (Ser/Thr protein kinase)
MPAITLQAEIENFDTLMEFVDGIAKKIGFTKSALYKINLATEEAIINVIKYAYPQNKEDITLTCDELTVPQKGLKLQISDRGIPFDPLAQAKPDTAQAIEERPIGGLGIHIIKTTADEISYKRENDTNIFTIIFYLPEE